MKTYTSRNLLFGKAPTRGKVFFLVGAVNPSFVEIAEEIVSDMDGEWYCNETMNGFRSKGREWLQMLNFDQYTSRGSVVGGINIALLSGIGGNWRK